MKGAVSGQYAGPVSRAAAAAIDLGVVLATYSAGLALTNFLLRALVDVSIEKGAGWLASTLLLAWAATYLVVSTAVTGRTVGKAIVGVKIVTREGRPLHPLPAVVRVVTFPLSTSTFALGLLLILLRRDHRGLHDLIARTAVVYDWGDRQAQLPGPLTAYLKGKNAV